MNENVHYYSISKVSEITGVSPHILRYWEKNFSFLKIQRDPAGRRIYSNKDIEKIRYIQRMLYNEGYRIKGVKKKFRIAYENKKKGKFVSIDFLKKILRRIEEIEKCLP